jgi:hypothetical protein
MIFAADHDGDGDCDLNAAAAQTSQPLRGLLKQAFVAGKTKKLLGKSGARQRPQTYAGATAKNDGGHLDHAF